MSFGIGTETAVGLTRHMAHSEKHEVVAEALAMAMGVNVAEPHPYAADLAGEGLKAATIAEVFNLARPSAMFTTSDFNLALNQTIGMIAAETSIVSTEHRAFCKLLDLPNLRPTGVPRYEGGELTERNGAYMEATRLGVVGKGESVSLVNYANYEAVSRQSIINAEWDHVAGIVRELIAAGLRRERTGVVELLEANPALGDGTAWFHSDRGNDISSASLNTTALGAAYAALRGLKPSNSDATLELPPAVLLVPASLEVTARVLVASMANGLSAGDPSRNQAGLNPAPLAVFADTRLTKVYLLPSPAQMPVVGVAHLTGQRQPAITTKVNQRTDELMIKASFDLAVSAVSPNAIRITLTG